MIKDKTTKVLKEQYTPNSEFYSQIIDSLQDYSIFTVDKELNINSWNSGATNIFQYSIDEIMGMPFETIFSKEDRENGIPQREIDVALKAGRSTDIRWHLCKDGKTFYADGLVFPLKNADDELIGFVKILRDITSRKLAEDAIKKYSKDLEELNTHKETVLSILSHDLRSPLAGIIQGAEYLKLNFDKIETSMIKNLLDEFHKATVNELNMLDYLVEWARIKYAADAFLPTNITLKDCINTVLESLKETASVKSLVFKNDVNVDSIVFADEKMLISIIQNLVSNAVKHSHNNGQIILTAKQKDDMTEVTIKDFGIGMSVSTINKLFFPQTYSLSKSVENNKGAGIGLLLVKGFLEKNNGKIWVESELGKGATFNFSIPNKK